MEHATAGPEPKRKKRASWQNTVLGILVGLVLIVVAYFAGLWIGRSEGRRNLSAQAARVSEVQTQALRAGSLDGLLRARGDLFQAALDLERRNFGTAAEDLDRARKTLDRVDPAEAGISAAQVQEIQRALSSINLNVQSDVGAQRARILDLTERLGSLIPDTAVPESAP